MCKKNRKISLLCPICGNDQFSFLEIENIDSLMVAEDETKIQCSDCKSIFTKAQLIEENREIININIEDLLKETVSDLERKLKKSLKLK